MNIVKQPKSRPLFLRIFVRFVYLGLFLLFLDILFAGFFPYQHMRIHHSLFSEKFSYSAPLYSPAFVGESNALQNTQIVPTLSTPIEEGKNVIWCASFQAAWKVMQKDFVKGPVELEGAEKICSRLNKSNDIAQEIPKDLLYANAGWIKDGITDTILKDVRVQFPSNEPPTFPSMPENSFLAYSYLESYIQFDRPYFQNTEPFVFKDKNGNETAINSFGIRSNEVNSEDKILKQPQILYFKIGDNERMKECAIDLDHSSKPCQIVVALIERKATLEETLQSLEKNMEPPLYRDYLSTSDQLVIPDVVYQISHHFTELENRASKNEVFKGKGMVLARQDICFRLDRSGGGVYSQVWSAQSSIPTDYFFNRPFLIYMKKRDTKQPFFVMWVENAELLSPWKEKRRGRQTPTKTKEDSNTIEPETIQEPII